MIKRNPHILVFSQLLVVLLLLVIACEYAEEPIYLLEPKCICDTTEYCDCDCDTEQPIRCECDTTEFQDCYCDTEDPQPDCDCDITPYRDCDCDIFDPYYSCECDTSPYYDCACDIDTIPYPISFIGEVQPVLENKCAECHLIFEESIAYKEITAQAYVNPANPEESILLEVVSSGRMPPITYPGLNIDEYKMILRWIEEGAKDN